MLAQIPSATGASNSRVHESWLAVLANIARPFVFKILYHFRRICILTLRITNRTPAPYHLRVILATVILTKCTGSTMFAFYVSKVPFYQPNELPQCNAIVTLCAKYPSKLPVSQSMLDKGKIIKAIGKAIKPSADEIGTNIRARSSVLRVAEKL